MTDAQNNKQTENDKYTESNQPKESQEVALNSYREKIDLLDIELQNSIALRAHYAHEIGEIKRRTEGSATFYRPEREAQVLRRVMERNQGPLEADEMVKIFRQIMSSCLALEQKLRVGFLGPEGTFTQVATLKHFGCSVDAVALNSIDEVFREVAAGAADYGVVPVENSSEGMVSHTLDTFMEYALKICGEVEVRIHHHLLVGDHAKPESIKRIYSHQQSLGQCRKWLDSHYPKAERVAVSSNAEAAKRVIDEWHAAAIAGELAQEKYHLRKIAENIEDNPQNTTRFLVIGRKVVPRSGEDKTSIIVSTKNKPGALHELIEPFKQRGISLTRIETRPSKTSNWSYVFFIDFEGHIDDEPVKAVLADIESNVVELKVLGSYPKAVV